MTGRLSDARLAELRRMVGGEEWRDLNPEDGAALIGEIDRLTAEHAKVLATWKALQADFESGIGRANTQRDDWKRIAEAERAQLLEAQRQVQAACCGPWHDREIAAETDRGSVRFAWDRIQNARELAASWSAYAQGRFDNGPDSSSDGWAVAATALHLVVVELDDDGTRPRDEPQSAAAGPYAGFAGTEPREAANTAQRPAEAAEPRPSRWSPPIVVSEETARTGVLPASEDEVLNLTSPAVIPAGSLRVGQRVRLTGRGIWAPQEPSVSLTTPVDAEPAPQDTGAPESPQEPATALLRWHYGPTNTDPNPGSMWCYACGAEVWSFKDGTIRCTGCGAEEPPEPTEALRTPEQWEAHYGLEIRDPDGWRGKDDPPWEQPLGLREFWRRFCQSTTRGIPQDTYDRIMQDLKSTPATTDESRNQ